MGRGSRAALVPSMCWRGPGLWGLRSPRGGAEWARLAHPPQARQTDPQASPDTDLNAVICKGTLLKDTHKRYIFYQLLRATKFIHSGRVIHRDQKVLPTPDC